MQPMAAGGYRNNQELRKHNINKTYKISINDEESLIEKKFPGYQADQVIRGNTSVYATRESSKSTNWT